MGVELDTAGVGKYVRLYADNAIYYENCFKYMGGGLYRVALGYDLIWDKEREALWMKKLDHHICQLEDLKSYYLEDLIVGHKTTISGFQWPRECPPKANNKLQQVFRVKQGERVLARVNLIDKPNHVDIELSNGKVYRLPWLKYNHLKQKGTFKHDRSKSTKQTGNEDKGRPRASNVVAFKHREGEPTRKVFNRMYLVR